MNDKTEGITVVKSGVWYTICNFLVNGINFITAPIFVRMMTHVEYGLYSNFLSWLGIFQVICSLMLLASIYSAKYDFAENIESYISSMLYLGFITTTAIYIVICLNIKYASKLMGIDPHYIHIMFAFLISYPATGFYQLRERMEYRYKNSILVSISTSILTVLGAFILMTYSNDKLSARIYGGRIPIIIINLIIIIYFLKKNNSIKIEHWKYALKICIPYIPHSLGMTVLSSSDRIMITYICGAQSTSYYNLAYTCAMIMNTITNAILAAFDPWLLERLNKHNGKQSRKVTTIMTLGYAYTTIGCMLIAPELLSILGGKSYLDAIVVMPPVILSTFYQYLYTMYGTIEQFKKKTGGMAIATGVAAITNIILNLIFIKTFGYKAAAYTTLVCYFILFLIHYYIVRHMNCTFMFNTKINIFLSVVVLFLGLLISYVYSMPLIRISLVVIYIGITLVFAKIKRNSLKNIYKIFKK